jgi:hypothetical protein
MTRAISAVIISLTISLALALGTKPKPQHHSIFWCVNTGKEDGPCRHVKAERAI